MRIKDKYPKMLSLSIMPAKIKKIEQCRRCIMLIETVELQLMETSELQRGLPHRQEGSRTQMIRAEKPQNTRQPR